MAIKPLLVAMACGGALGLSAPGFGVWWLAWCALAPLFLLASSSAGLKEAFARGLAFGMAYNLVCLNWYLGLQPLDWLGFNAWQGWALAIAAWLIVAFHQALIVGLFSAIFRLIPLTTNWWFEKKSSKWLCPAVFITPLLWVLVVNRIGNAHDALGVPWTLIEYSQYKQISLIQITSLIGGIGLGFLIVAVNMAVAVLIATYFDKAVKCKTLCASSRGHAFYQTLAAALLLIGIVGFGFWKSSNTVRNASHRVSVVQANVNIEMQKMLKHYSLDDLLNKQLAMSARYPSALCIWNESALPAYLSSEPGAIIELHRAARKNNLDFVIGAMDRDAGVSFNSAYGITSGGSLVNTIYHKRYLVPFGEYTPLLVQYMPEWVKRLTNTPAGKGFGAGGSPAVLNLDCGAVGPLICFETLSPELVASSTRHGAQLLVNISDLAWFHDSKIGEQMIAFSVLRAVENGRYFVFAANTGPSAIIDPTGHVTFRSKQGVEEVLFGKVGFSRELTPFTRWYIF